MDRAYFKFRIPNLTDFRTYNDYMSTEFVSACLVTFLFWLWVIAFNIIFFNYIVVFASLVFN